MPEEERLPCNARIMFGDPCPDYFHENQFVFHCKLPEGHEGNHMKSSETYELRWTGNEIDPDGCHCVECSPPFIAHAVNE